MLADDAPLCGLTWFGRCLALQERRAGILAKMTLNAAGVAAAL
ncbi:hypothetical protein AB0L26_33725 [Streptomyces nondiastaticus]